MTQASVEEIIGNSLEERKVGAPSSWKAFSVVICALSMRRIFQQFKILTFRNQNEDLIFIIISSVLFFLNVLSQVRLGRH